MTNSADTDRMSHTITTETPRSSRGEWCLRCSCGWLHTFSGAEAIELGVTMGELLNYLKRRHRGERVGFTPTDPLR